MLLLITLLLVAFLLAGSCAPFGHDPWDDHPSHNQYGDDPGNGLSDDELYHFTNDTIDAVHLCRPSRDISYVRPHYHLLRGLF